jgi:hypothetical protein
MVAAAGETGRLKRRGRAPVVNAMSRQPGWGRLGIGVGRATRGRRASEAPASGGTDHGHIMGGNDCYIWG